MSWSVDRRLMGRRLSTAAIGCLLLLLGLVGSTPAIGQTERVEVVRDVRYVVRPDGPLALDAYLPPGRGPHPAVLVIPGGKWMFIDKTKNDWLPRKIARGGVAAFSIEYRPSPEAPFPAALEDAQAAVRFVRAHAARFHIDPARLGAVGGSSGGHLAALLATWGAGPTDAGSRVRVAISWSGPMDLADLLRLRGREDVVDVVETFLGCSAPADCAGPAAEASPITHVDPSDGAMYLSNSTEEIIPASQAESMAAELERARVPHELILLNGRHHGFNSASSYKGFDPAFAFLQDRIGSSEGPGPVASPTSSPTKDPALSGAEGLAGARGPKENKDDEVLDHPSWLPQLALTALALAALALGLVVSLVWREHRRRAAPDGSNPAVGPVTMQSVGDPGADGS
jgi:acetyl esterase